MRIADFSSGDADSMMLEAVFWARRWTLSLERAGEVGEMCLLKNLRMSSLVRGSRFSASWFAVVWC